MSESRQRLDGTTPSTDGVEERELRAVSLLLRGLPDPEPPSQLVDRVIAEVARREARPRVIRIFGRLPGPAVGTALAAGVSCLVLFGAIQGGLLVGGESPPAPREVAARLVPTKARLVSTGTDASAARLRRPVVPSFASATVIDPQLAVYVGIPPHDDLPSPLAAGTGSRINSLDRRLDRQLNHLLLDPISFYQRIDRVRDAERFVSRLAERSARRGDAPGVALHLREHARGHPHTVWLVERFLRAVIDNHVAAR